MASEITEEGEVEPPHQDFNSEDQKNSIRRIINYQKSLYYASSSSSSFASAAAAAVSSPSFSSSRKSNSLIDLMKAGNTSLRRLFDMEHTSLASYFKDYSSSPMIRPIPLWGSDTDDENHDDPWISFRNYGGNVDPGNDSRSALASQSSSPGGIIPIGPPDEKPRIRKQKLSRKKSFRRLPRFSVWRCGGFRFRLRLKRLRLILFRGRKF